MSDYLAQLVVQIGAQPEQQYDILQNTITIGRDPLNEVVISDAEVSRRHAQISLSPEENAHYIEDLGSTNGTFVNGRRVTTQTLIQHDDTIELGQAVSMVFRLPVDTLQAANTLVYDRSSVEEDTQNSVQPSLDLPTEVTDDDEAYYVQPPPQQRVVSAPYPVTNRRGGCRRWLAGCGCALLLIIAILAAAGFFLDSFAPDLLYCGPIQPFWELLEPIFRLAGRTLACP
jgi:hypothetical protein